MKKKLFVVLSALLAVFVAIVTTNTEKNLKNKNVPLQPEVLGEPSDQENIQTIDITYNDNSYKVSYVTVTSMENFSLHENLSSPLTSDKIYMDNTCDVLTSAGFYTKDSKPIGLFTYNYQTIRGKINSSTFDGFFTVNDFDTPRITKYVPEDRLRIALQSGPVLIENALPIQLSLANDKKDRRMVLGVTGDNEVVILSLYEGKSKLSGPTLEEIPNLLTEFGKNTGIVLADAINLDGGTASTMMSSGFKLTESAHIGSYFCINN